MSVLSEIRDRLIGTKAKEAQAEIAKLQEINQIAANNAELHTLELTERLAELELAIEDIGWQRIINEQESEISRTGLRRIHALCRLNWIKNPLIRRAVETQANYVFGQGVEVQSKVTEINDVIQEFWDDTANQSELTSHQAMMEKERELQNAGNLFFVFFTDTITGRVRVRSIPFIEICDGDILSNPDDRKEPWYYLRRWTQQGFDAQGTPTLTPMTAYYPDWRFNPRVKPKQMGGITVHWESPCFHVPVNRMSDMKLGIPEMYSAIDWARAYKEFLEDWSKIVKSYSRFAWKMTTPGGSTAVAAAKAKLNSTLTTSSSETNPPPVTGATFIGTENVKLEAMRTAGATTSADDARHLRLMVASSTGIFDHYLAGDPSQGNLATATAMEYPMLIQFRNRQQLWKSIFIQILNYVVDQAIKVGKLKGRQAVADGLDIIDVTAGGQMVGDRQITVEFPSILQNNAIETIQAIIGAATLNGQQLAGTIDIKLVARLMLVALGVEDVDQVLDDLFRDEGEQVDKPEEPSQQDKGEDPTHGVPDINSGSAELDTVY